MFLCGIFARSRAKNCECPGLFGLAELFQPTMKTLENRTKPLMKP